MGIQDQISQLPVEDDFPEAFTHVSDPRDVMTAYYAASQIQVYLASAFGMGKVAEMLRLWGEGKRNDEVIQKALGMPSPELDRRFRAWLGPRLARYDSQFVPDAHAHPERVRRRIVQLDGPAIGGPVPRKPAAGEAGCPGPCVTVFNGRRLGLH